ncbi:MAG: hypothetical protein KatS3mg070_2262 [Meiothermus sp.]|uniref:DNA-processing protein DprA n=1 Tax=Meiothermus sp. TaxID=1955249 RepID=UPI0021DDF9C2|nr:DNA-processing protein DprA [Meiothermus sp.]GIW28899.1 MAG: hypothetical protein KatS3mg070_2262 [Meiothermus sp.]
MPEPSEVTRKLLTLSKLRGVGASSLLKLAQAEGFVKWDYDEIASRFPSIGRALTQENLNQAQALAQRDLAACKADGSEIISVLDPQYPPLLRQTPDRPALLYVKGNLKPTHHRAVAVVGTREPTEHGKVITQRITTYLGQQGWSIVSGLALGVDGIAHQAALEVGGHTVAILAHGLDTITPKSHTVLAKSILEAGGAWVSEYAYGIPPFAPQYVKRDRIQAGLARGVVLIQTGLEGGSLHASRAALRYGRVLAVPAPTKTDIAAGEEKVQGVLKILQGSRQEVARYLQCNPADLDRILVIRSREQYPQLEDALNAIGEGVNPQKALF